MSNFLSILENFISFKRVPMRAIIITALASYALQLGMIIQGQPLYIIVLFTLLPWIPVLFFEGIWKIQHFHWIAFFGVLVILQLGHFAEHVTQVGALATMQGTLACPPPVDTAENAQRATDAGLRLADSGPTGLSSAVIVVPNSEGMSTTDADGNVISGPPACGIFGQLDLEIVHLVWEIGGWILTLILLTKYSHNRWLWLAIFWFTIHTVEHVFISYTFFFDPETTFAGTKQLWGTVANGNIVTAYPVGLQDVVTNFYGVAGKFGIAAKNGLLSTFIPSLNPILPTRPWLHFWYNFFIAIPTFIAFFIEVRKAYDEYLAEALPKLSKEQLVEATPKLARHTFKPGDVIIKQGDPATEFYIIASGEVEVVHEEPDGSEEILATLHHGQYFGEIGLMHEGKRIATVRAKTDTEVMSLDRNIFIGLMDNSEMSRADIERVMEKRQAELDAIAAAQAK